MRQLRRGLNARRDDCRAFDPTDPFPTNRTDLAVSSSALDPDKARPMAGEKNPRAETFPESARSGDVGAGASALTLGTKVASPASGIWVRCPETQLAMIRTGALHRLWAVACFWPGVFRVGENEVPTSAVE